MTKSLEIFSFLNSFTMLIECLSAILIILLVIAVNGYVTRNRQIPGPFQLPLIGGAYVYFGHFSADQFLSKMMDLVQKYKGTFSMLNGFEKYIVITKPEHVQVYWTSPHLLDRAVTYDVYKAVFEEGLFTANGTSWKSKRRAWTPSFHPSLIRTFVKSFQNQSEHFVEKLKKEINGPEFPLYPHAQDYAMKVLFSTQLEFGHIEQCETRNLSESVVRACETVYNKIFNLFFHNEMIFKLSASGKKFKEDMDYVRKYLKSAVEKKAMDYADEGALADDDLRGKTFLRQLSGVRKASKELAIDEILTMIIAGADTTSNVLGFIALMLGRHQDVQERVFREDEEIQRYLNGQELEMDDLDKYEYLDRVIKETLRLFPVGTIVRRKAARDVEMGDITIPKGSTLGCFIFALHRNPEIYPNPLKFNPDNFLPERIAQRHPYSYMPFGGGPRNCIGMKYAMASLKVFISTFVRNYRVFSNRSVEDIKLRLGFVLGDTDHFLIRIKER